MAEKEFEKLSTKYGSFAHPLVSLEVSGEKLDDNKYGIGISDVRVELSAGYEASIATFRLYNIYDRVNATFLFDRFKKYVLLGSSVVISMGYEAAKPEVEEVFRGFIAKVNFLFEEDEIPCIQVTAMDVKGAMMNNNSAKQLKAKSYSAAMDEILAGEPYASLKAEGIFTSKEIKKTPDAKDDGAGGGAAGAGGEKDQTSDTYTVEMVSESDYEFFVRAAKRFNYDFFVTQGQILFRPAKSETTTYMDLGPTAGMRNINVEYDITGLYGQIEVRNVDPAKGTVISSKKKISNKISQGNKAKSVVGNLEKVYIDPTVTSKDDAEHRANYLVENMSYRFGTLESDMIGLPEILPGRFIRVNGLGTDVDNVFYLQEVIHMYSGDGVYKTKVIGKAATITDPSSGGLGGAGGFGSGGASGFF